MKKDIVGTVIKNMVEDEQVVALLLEDGEGNVMTVRFEAVGESYLETTINKFEKHDE